ncbi:hypothetical protein NE237_005562 [Protea cynaroides]|uniref:Uncharacterized protein n=1 Tax=Protea cynaroides TaxID=273540 RepID=A0A9Q0JQT0_9MAGN|nr:hypothetical protein NE237_005562 [Protea cynaroides]
MKAIANSSVRAALQRQMERKKDYVENSSKFNDLVKKARKERQIEEISILEIESPMATSEASKLVQDRMAIITSTSRLIGCDITSLGAKLVLNYTSSSSYSLSSLLTAEINNPISRDPSQTSGDPQFSPPHTVSDSYRRQFPFLFC